MKYHKERAKPEIEVEEKWEIGSHFRFCTAE